MGEGGRMLIKVESKSDGNVALAEVKVIGSVFGFKEPRPGSPEPTVAAMGSSRRHPEDSSNREVGKALATARALQLLGKKLERAAHGHVKHIDDMRERRLARREERWENFNEQIAERLGVK